MVPTASYLICSTPRSGSTLLAEALGATKVAGRPNEHFDEGFEPRQRQTLGAANDADLLAKILKLGAGENGVFGAKTHWYQFEYLISKLKGMCGCDAPPPPELLNRFLPGLRYVYITRLDKVAQAVSFHKAVRTEVWWDVKEVPPRPSPAAGFDYNAIDEHLNLLTTYERQWTSYFRQYSIRPLTICYEELVADYADAVRRVVRFLV